MNGRDVERLAIARAFAQPRGLVVSKLRNMLKHSDGFWLNVSVRIPVRINGCDLTAFQADLADCDDQHLWLEVEAPPGSETEKVVLLPWDNIAGIELCGDLTDKPAETADE